MDRAGGAGKPTLRTIAGLTGLAVPTVSRALSDAPDLRAETKALVRRVAAEIGEARGAPALDFGGELVGLRLIDIVHGERISTAQHALRHRRAHAANAHKSDMRQCHPDHPRPVVRNMASGRAKDFARRDKPRLFVTDE